MRQFRFYVISLIIIVCVTCNNISHNKEHVYNGINSQILDIVDSMQTIDEEQYPFITISFLRCNDDSYIVRFLNGIIIPALPVLPVPNRRILISEGEGFKGYKKYGTVYLVFEEYNPNGNFEKFVDKDSLVCDEISFEEYNVYEHMRHRSCKSIEKKYLINENDSLIFYDGKCLFDMD